MHPNISFLTAAVALGLASIVSAAPIVIVPSNTLDSAGVSTQGRPDADIDTVSAIDSRAVINSRIARGLLADSDASRDDEPLLAFYDGFRRR
ncbi:hypothetical protein DENSPDRAFT_880806 [Dentipellis sp. KUC8613]|nr:hypothetical protein DENSPDRAFT_880806 [Dentipellis sp. KUC8613]